MPIPTDEFIRSWHDRAVKATRAAHNVLAAHESSASRVVILEDLLKRLTALPSDVQDYFREATICLSNNLRRAAIVLSWAGFFHVLAQHMYLNNLPALRKDKPKWKFKTLEDLKESYVEHQILEAARSIGTITKSKLRIYQGQLSKRNQCAHPTIYNPSLNSALGFVDDMIRQTVEYI